MVHLKSPREVEKLRAAADLVGLALAEVAKLVEPGRPLIELDQAAERFLRKHGARPAFKGYQFSDDVVPFPGTLCLSVNDVVVHGIPTDYRLQEGDILVADCGAELDGFYGDYAYTFPVGEISEEDAQLCRVTYEALYRGIEQAVAGNRIGHISGAVQDHCESHGYGVVYDLVGHGIGRSLHEDPSVPNVRRDRRGRKMKPGLTMCIEPMVNRGTPEVTTDADGWTVRSADGLPSAHYEHMVLVTDGEPEILSTFSHIEAVIDAPYTQAEVYG